MTNRFVIMLAVPLLFAAPSPALADATASTVFDTVDSVELNQRDLCVNGSTCFIHTIVVVTGILGGASTSTSRSFDFVDKADIAAHCQRLAMVAMSKPGKYRFGIGADGTFSPPFGAPGHGACRLTLVSP